MNNRRIWDMAEAFLAQHASFTPLTPSQRRLLLSHTEIHHLAPQQALLRPGQNSRHCWLLFSGNLLRLHAHNGEPQAEQLDQIVPRELHQAKVEYFQPGDFVGIEQLVEYKIADSHLFALDEEVLLLAFSPSELRIVFQKSPAMLRRLQPELDLHGNLYAGLPEKLWQYFQRQRYLARLSYQPLSLHVYRSWQPLLFSLSLFFLLFLLLPRPWAYQLRYPLLAAGALLFLVLLKLRYSCEVIVSERSLIVSSSKGLSLHYQACVYPLSLISQPSIKNWLLCPFLPSVGTFEFEFSGEKKKLSWISSPHKLYNIVCGLKQQLAEQRLPALALVKRPQTNAATRPGALKIHKSLPLLVLIVASCLLLSLPLAATPLAPPWLFACYLIMGIALLLLGIGWYRFYWLITPEGLFCYDGFAQQSPPWKLVRRQEIDAVRVDQNWLGKILRYGTVTVYSRERQEKIRLAPHPYRILEQMSLMRLEPNP